MGMENWCLESDACPQRDKFVVHSQILCGLLCIALVNENTTLIYANLIWKTII